MFQQLDEIRGKLNQIFSEPQNHPTSHEPVSKNQQQNDESQCTVPESGQPFDSNTQSKAKNMDFEATEASVQEESKSTSLSGQTTKDVEMAEAVDPERPNNF